MSDAKMSGEFEKWWDERRPRFSEIRVIAESAWDAAQAAAIAERDEALDILSDLMEHDCPVDDMDPRMMTDGWKAALRFLEAYGRVIRDGETYRWAEKEKRDAS